jgi:hypothetical protein
MSPFDHIENQGKEMAMKVKERYAGETYRPMAKVLKTKSGVPTKIRINGVTYALIHDDYINGNKNKVKK